MKETSLSFEDVVIDSLRGKNFSHSSIIDTAKELGAVSRTLVSENLRGMALRTLVENDFNIEKTISIISGSEDEETKNRVRSKIQTFISNIENDLKHINNKDFEEIKKRLSAKYKNLPLKYHHFLDEVIKWKAKNRTK